MKDGGATDAGGPLAVAGRLAPLVEAKPSAKGGCQDGPVPCIPCGGGGAGAEEIVAGGGGGGGGPKLDGAGRDVVTPGSAGANPRSASALRVAGNRYCLRERLDDTSSYAGPRKRKMEDGRADKCHE